MDLVIKNLERISKGHATTLYDFVVIRVGDRYIVGKSPSIRERGVSLEDAAKIICGK